MTIFHGDNNIMSVKSHKAGLSVRQHYHLVAGEIVFRMTEDDPPSALRLNSVIISDDGRIPVRLLSRAQQSLQMQFHKRFEGLPPKVLDVVVVGLFPLGLFTKEEFNAAPEGMALREQTGVGHA